jgi:hypothetical protein
MTDRPAEPLQAEAGIEPAAQVGARPAGAAGHGSRAPGEGAPAGSEVGGAPDDMSGADRDAAVAVLAARRVGLWQLVLLGLSGGCGVLGWACAALTVESFEQGGLGAVTGFVLGLLTLFGFVLAAILAGVWTRRGREAQDALDDWAYPLTYGESGSTYGDGAQSARGDFDDDGSPGAGYDDGKPLPPYALCGPPPPTDPRAVALVERRWRCGTWLAVCCSLCVFAAWQTAVTGSESASASLTEMLYAFGLGLSALVTGVLGVVRAASHMRWSARWLGTGYASHRGGAHR